ncbi:MAG: hypothetical protein ABI702_14845 [Burkholderiales bacterium]
MRAPWASTTFTVTGIAGLTLCVTVREVFAAAAWHLPARRTAMWQEDWQRWQMWSAADGRLLGRSNLPSRPAAHSVVQHVCAKPN